MSCSKYYYFHFPRRKQAQWGLVHTGLDHTASMWLLDVWTQGNVPCHQDGFGNKPTELWRQKQGPISDAEEDKQPSLWIRQDFLIFLTRLFYVKSRATIPRDRHQMNGEPLRNSKNLKYSDANIQKARASLSSRSILVENKNESHSQQRQ